MISLLHDQWLILKQVLLQSHMHNSGHEESDQSLLPACLYNLSVGTEISILCN